VSAARRTASSSCVSDQRCAHALPLSVDAELALTRVPAGVDGVDSSSFSVASSAWKGTSARRCAGAVGQPEDVEERRPRAGAGRLRRMTASTAAVVSAASASGTQCRAGRREAWQRQCALEVARRKRAGVQQGRRRRNTGASMPSALARHPRGRFLDELGEPPPTAIAEQRAVAVGLRSRPAGRPHACEPPSRAWPARCSARTLDV